MKEIFNRRSVRNFTGETIAKDDIIQLLKAAMRAPSAVNQQPWEFIVIEDKSTLAKIMEIHPYAKMLDKVGCAIVVCGNKERFKSQHDYWVQDCSAATQNLLLEIVHLNLGGVWLGVYPNKDRVADIKQLLNLPEYITPLNIVAVGHPSKMPEPIDTFNPDRIHFEGWK